METARRTRTNGRMPVILKTRPWRKGATPNTTPGAMRRKTRGARNHPRAKTTPPCLPHIVPDRQEAPKSSGLPGQRSTSRHRQPFRSLPREGSPSARSPRWTATSLLQTGERRWRCSLHGAAWGRARWNLPAWRPARPRRRTRTRSRTRNRRRRRRRRAKLPSQVNQLNQRNGRIQVQKCSSLLLLSLWFCFSSSLLNFPCVLSHLYFFFFSLFLTQSSPPLSFPSILSHRGFLSFRED